MADGKDYYEALKNIEIVISEWVDTAISIGREVPLPKSNIAYAASL